MARSFLPLHSPVRLPSLAGVRRVALVKPSALGDIIHALPVLEAVRIACPDARISWIVNRSLEPLVAGHPLLHETIAFDRSMFRGGLWKGIGLAAEFWKSLRQRRFDLTIDLQGLARSGLMTLATAAPVRIGLSTSREGSRRAYTHVVPVDEVGIPHAVDRLWQVAHALGVGDLPVRFRVPVRAEEVAGANAELEGLPRPWVVVSPGARWMTKRWRARHFGEIARRIHAEFGGTILLTGSPDEADLAAEVLAPLTGPAIDLIGRTPLPRLIALLSRADLTIGNDSGPLHLAAALGRRVVAPYTCTSIERHGPRGERVRALATAVACRASYLRTCPNMVCMDELTPERLWPTVRESLAVEGANR